MMIIVTDIYELLVHMDIFENILIFICLSDFSDSRQNIMTTFSYISISEWIAHCLNYGIKYLQLNNKNKVHC